MEKLMPLNSFLLQCNPSAVMVQSKEGYMLAT